MIDIIYYYTNLRKILEGIKVYDLIPENFDYKKNKYAIEVKVAEWITEDSYKQNIPLQFRIVGNKDNKTDILKVTKELDKLINKQQFDNNLIVREDAYFDSYLDKEKYNTILKYKIKCFELERRK